MNKFNLVRSLLLPAAILTIVGCTKTKNINNNQVIATPYSLYFTDTAGTLYSSTDGRTSSVIFAADGVANRCIFAMNSNLLMAKSALYVSSDNGTNFNYSYDAAKVATYPKTNNHGRYYDMNQSMAIFLPQWSNHGYIVSRDPDPTNYFGFAWNASDGLNGWTPESTYDPLTVIAAHVGNIRVTSFTCLQNNTAIALDANTKRGLYRANFNPLGWSEMQSSTGIPDSLDMPGGNTNYSLGHINNRVIAIDNNGSAGACYSDDLGATWHQYTGLPANTPLTCIASPFEQICMVGTDSMGLFTINNNTNSFEQVSNGLGTNLVVRSIAFKENVFKSGTKQQYIYIATNQGIYQSSDLGHNWTKTIPGNFVAIY
ncbi:hypothetical protein CJD36_007390 [Flavipsychrobacter stenotrophus]|uniref:Glycosyl hydrolase n=1 Tax=Flavipsychrobacter stenotrophus TaxID=2077091 RepID=A0A2S7SYA8_9BACT|nr:hypothetical protein [Flavipsychrobacter stenotrophus]PQJ11611.1 hypothetical protein CJD36_007390 [Flavipsychrobacter stenotrophus]